MMNLAAFATALEATGTRTHFPVHREAAGWRCCIDFYLASYQVAYSLCMGAGAPPLMPRATTRCSEGYVLGFRPRSKHGVVAAAPPLSVAVAKQRGPHLPMHSPRPSRAYTYWVDIA